MAVLNNTATADYPMGFDEHEDNASAGGDAEFNESARSGFSTDLDLTDFDTGHPFVHASNADASVFASNGLSSNYQGFYNLGKKAGKASNPMHVTTASNAPPAMIGYRPLNSNNGLSVNASVQSTMTSRPLVYDNKGNRMNIRITNAHALTEDGQPIDMIKSMGRWTLAERDRGWPSKFFVIVGLDRNVNIRDLDAGEKAIVNDSRWTGPDGLWLEGIFQEGSHPFWIPTKVWAGITGYQHTAITHAREGWICNLIGRKEAEEMKTLNRSKRVSDWDIPVPAPYEREPESTWTPPNTLTRPFGVPILSYKQALMIREQMADNCSLQGWHTEVYVVDADGLMLKTPSTDFGGTKLPQSMTHKEVGGAVLQGQAKPTRPARFNIPASAGTRGVIARRPARPLGQRLSLISKAESTKTESPKTDSAPGTPKLDEETPDPGPASGPKRSERIKRRITTTADAASMNDSPATTTVTDESMLSTDSTEDGESTQSEATSSPVSTVTVVERQIIDIARRFAGTNTMQTEIGSAHLGTVLRSAGFAVTASGTAPQGTEKATSTMTLSSLTAAERQIVQATRKYGNTGRMNSRLLAEHLAVLLHSVGFSAATNP